MTTKTQLPLYKQIYQKMKADIESGIYPAGAFLPPERALCESFHIQRLTLRKALALLAEENYIQKFRGAGSKVIFAYTLEEHAPKNLIAYVMPGTESELVAQPYHMEICNYLEKYCNENNFSLLFIKVNPREPLPPFLTNAALVKGIIWVSHIDDSFLDAACRLKIPSIIFSNSHPRIPKINIDDINCAFRATQTLIDKGCTRIVHISGTKDYINTIQRLEGYRRALLVNGIPFREELVCTGDWNFHSGFEQISQLIETGIVFDGIYCANDMMALGAIKAAVQGGLKIPDAVKIIGTDNIDQSAMSIPSLSTISVRQQDIAHMSFLLLKELMEGRQVPDQLLVAGTLIERETT